MKIVTFNLRRDGAGDGVNSFSNRKYDVAKKLLLEKPDIIGFQETLPGMTEFLRDNMPGYYLIGRGRAADFSGEQMVIAYRYDRLTLFHTDTFALSPTPLIPGSVYEGQSPCPRTFIDTVFFSKEFGGLIRVINTHLDHVGVEARRLGIGQILSYCDSVREKLPLIIMGDFNAFPDSPELQPIDSRPDMHDLTRELGGTYHGFGEKADCPEKIDYIYCDDSFVPLGAKRWIEAPGERYLSDHYAVEVNVGM